MQFETLFVIESQARAPKAGDSGWNGRISARPPWVQAVAEALSPNFSPERVACSGLLWSRLEAGWDCTSLLLLKSHHSAEQLLVIEGEATSV